MATDKRVNGRLPGPYRAGLLFAYLIFCHSRLNPQPRQNFCPAEFVLPQLGQYITGYKLSQSRGEI